MFMIIALGFVVLTHLMLIGVAMMTLAAAAGVVLYVTRPRTSSSSSTSLRLLPSAGPPRDTQNQTTEDRRDDHEHRLAG